MALKELEVRYATKRSKDYKLADGGGLYLLVRPNGSKLWRFKYRFDAKEKLLSFGAYPHVGLAEARLRHAQAKVALGQGTDPGAKAKPSVVTTFEDAARVWHANRLKAVANAALGPNFGSPRVVALGGDWLRAALAPAPADTLAAR